jgi:hypothetical protein
MAVSSYLSELADVLNSELMSIFIDRAFCDESYGPDIKTSLWYVVAGFLGTRQQWRKFERVWRPHVDDGFDFHAHRLVRSGRHSDKQRGLVQAIGEGKLKGVVATMDLRAFRVHREAIRNTIVEDGHELIDEYNLTFIQYVQLTAKRLDTSGRRIAFVYDRRPPQKQGRMELHREFYEGQRDNPAVDFRHRLGPITADDRHHAIGLHASDFLANCAYHHMCGSQLWQWNAVNDAAAKMITFSYDENFWLNFIQAATS